MLYIRLTQIKINGEELPNVRQVATSNGNRSQVRCVSKDESDINELYDYLKSFSENDKVTFEVVSDNGYEAQFDGHVQGITRRFRETTKVYELNFTAEPLQ